VQVPAIVIKLTPGKLTVEYACKVGAEWGRERRVVSRKKVSLRMTPARELG